MIKIAIDNDHMAQKTSGHLNVSDCFDSGSVVNIACSTIHNPVLVINNSIKTKTRMTFLECTRPLNYNFQSEIVIFE